MPAWPVHNIDEIPHETVIKYSVVEISTDAGCEKSKTNIKQFPLISTGKKNNKTSYQCNNRNRHQKTTLSGGNSKSGAGVQCSFKVQKAIYD